ncbi:hypothetical protein [uncultured Tateyamaria sp.]|uniref:hypothetical protein n=1 Tax=Tateyamaria sp. 1078 TaxID=3417464 RepID=UPI00260B8F91|nr:hypothetical protein [uncultured Tateyamaria sp.]
MTPEHHRRGGAAVAALNRMDTWEADLVLNLRLWCEGPPGQLRIRTAFETVLSGAAAARAWDDFDTLLRRIVATASRPMVRHDIGCNCVGSDECVFAHLVRTASDGHLNDAALIATLLVGPAHAEHIAILAGEVGSCARRIHHLHPHERIEAAHILTRLH